jgi:membrane protein
VGFSRYNAIYGSFAALPLFLIWVQLSWLVFLFGAEISSALENMRSYGIKKDYLLLSSSKKRMLSLLVLKKITNSFKSDQEAPGVQELAHEIRLPVQYLIQITDTLVKSKLVTRIIGEDEHQYGFQPAKDIANLSFAEALEKLDKIGDNRILINRDIDSESIDKSLDAFIGLINENYSKLLIKDL